MRHNYSTRAGAHVQFIESERWKLGPLSRQDIDLIGQKILDLTNMTMAKIEPERSVEHLQATVTPTQNRRVKVEFVFFPNPESKQSATRVWPPISVSPDDSRFRSGDRDFDEIELVDCMADGFRGQNSIPTMSCWQNQSQFDFA